MERITMAIDETLARAFDQIVERRGYRSRSEAMRDLMRRAVEGDRLKSDRRSFCVATLSYVYNHRQRDLTERLTDAQHAQHDLIVASTHVHLDHEHCLETVVLKGPTAAVRALANRLQAERGVRHGHINVISVERGDKHGGTSADHHHHGHLHLIPKI